MVQQWEAIEIDIDGRTQKVRPVGPWVMDSRLHALEYTRITDSNSIQCPKMRRNQ